MCKETTDNFIIIKHDDKPLCIKCEQFIIIKRKLFNEYMNSLDDITFYKTAILERTASLKSLREYELEHPDCFFTKLTIRDYENKKRMCKLALLQITTDDDSIIRSCAEKIIECYKESQEIHDELSYIDRLSDGKYLNISNHNKDSIEYIQEEFGLP
jgi:hypothetical protein